MQTSKSHPAKGAVRPDKAGQGEDKQDPLDEALEESFPASDPPAISQPSKDKNGPNKND